MKLKDACSVIESIYGFDDETSSAGEAWGAVREEVKRLEAENERLRKEAELGKDLARHIRNLPTAELDSDALILAHKVLGSKAP